MIFIDALKYHPDKTAGYDMWAHLWTDGELSELHEFAQKTLGLQSHWFQNDPRLPHYDIAGTRLHRRAIKKGAIITSIKEYLAVKKSQEEKK